MDFSSALSRKVHETRNHLRMVGCSVAAYNTEAQGAQESLSKVREGQGHGRAPLRGAGSVKHSGGVGPLPCLWARLPLTNSQHAVARRSLTDKCALRWGQREWKALPGILRLKVTARTELPECQDIFLMPRVAEEVPGYS